MQETSYKREEQGVRGGTGHVTGFVLRHASHRLNLNIVHAEGFIVS